MLRWILILYIHLLLSSISVQIWRIIHKHYVLCAYIHAYFYELNGACAVLQVEWQNTSAFVSKHFRELLYLLDPVLRAWSPYLPQVTMSVWRSLITWLGPLSGSRLRLVLAMMQQSLPDKQRLELSILALSWGSGVMHFPNSGMAPQTL